MATFAQDMNLPQTNSVSRKFMLQAIRTRIKYVNDLSVSHKGEKPELPLSDVEKDDRLHDIIIKIEQRQ